MHPPDLSKGVEKFLEFHDMEPRKTGRFNSSLKIPSKMYRAGEALWIFYESNKWNDGMHKYKHEHSYGVHVYRPDKGHRVEEVPKVAKNSKTFVRLGSCLGFIYKCDGEEIEAITKKPYPDLYCTPDGSVLLVIQGKSRLEAMIWGGNLDVKRQGIVG